MTVHFICRGNTFRSIIAETYLRSLELAGVETVSSGTIGKAHKEANKHNFQLTRALLDKHGILAFANKDYGNQLPAGKPAAGDVVVCMNDRVRQEGEQIGVPLKSAHVWDITDIGEPGRIPKDEAERISFMEDTYQEIVAQVNKLVTELHTSAA